MRTEAEIRAHFMNAESGKTIKRARKRPLVNFWLAIAVISIFSTIMTLVLGSFAAFSFFQYTLLQGNVSGVLSAWWQTLEEFRAIGVAGFLLAVAGFFSYGKYVKALRQKEHIADAP